MNPDTTHTDPQPHQAAAFEHNGATVSRQRFYEIACDTRRSVVVEACAGAGKTWMLVSRILRALLDGCAPQDILAITFTKKAAAEMRQRLQQWLQEFSTASDEKLTQELLARGLRVAPGAEGTEKLQQLRQLHRKLLSNGRSVQISTFHSWFAALVRSAPLAVLDQLGLPTHYELLENDAKAIVHVWRRFQGRIAQDPQGRCDYVDTVSAYGRHQTQKALEAALNKRTEFVLADAWGVVDASVQHFTVQFPALAGLQDPMEYLFSAQGLSVLQNAARALGAQTAKKCQTAAHALQQGIQDRNAAAIVAALFTQKGEPRKLGDDFAGAEWVRQAQDLMEQVNAADHQHQAWLHQQRMARLTRLLVQEYAALKRERGWLDMADLERTALALMEDPVLSGWVQERLDARVRHLLIDEFQDTNPLQWQTLHAWLSGYPGAAQAPGVFIVGDPKQSIYRFRRAEPQVFLAAIDFVRQGLGGELLSCDHTRRNALAVVGLVNEVMQEAQSAGEFAGFRDHTTESLELGEVLKLPRIARDAKTTGQDALPPQWRDSLTTPRFEEEENRKSLECRQAAQWIAQRLAQTGQGGRILQPGDVMVLARKRERLSLLQAELSALHIAALQPEKNDLADMPEVQDLVALLDVLVSDRHDISLARVLKSPLFGVADDALVQLVQMVQHTRTLQANPGTAGSWLQTLQGATGLPEVLQAAGTTLTRWQQWVHTLPPHDALSAIYQSGDVLARYAAASPPDLRERVLANLNALPNAALAVDGGRYTTAWSLVRALRAGGIAAPVRANPQAVRLLTIHGAKGLEAPVVVLLDTDGELQRAESMGVLVQWPGEDLYPSRFVFLASESRPSACSASAVAMEQAARRREELNALYVALTRSRHTLVVSSMEPRLASAGSWWQRLQARAQEVAVDPPPGTPQAANIATPADAVLRVLAPMATPAPSLWDPANPQTPPDTPEAPESPESRIGQAMHRLLEWLPALPGGYSGDLPEPLWSAAQIHRVAHEFLLDDRQAQTACTMAHGIAQGQGAWCWDTHALRWHANELPLGQAGRLLRIDRLVQNHAGEWWVLDYKSGSQPWLQPDLCAQLRAYQAAVANAYPGQTVRCAFLTPQGALTELS